MRSIAIGFDGSAVDTTLGTTSDLPLTLTSHGVAGTITLSATGLPASWDATFSPSPTVPLEFDGTVHPILHVSVPTDGDATTATITVIATTGGGVPDAQDAVGMIVQNKMVVAIPAGTGSGNHGFPAQLTLRVGTLLSFRNDDTDGHIIHSDGGPFPHQDSSVPIGTGQSYDVVVSMGTTEFYCHVHGQWTGTGNLTVQ